MLERAVLKENQMFLVSDLSGDVLAQATDGQGLYFRDTRHLSVYEFCLSGARPQHLSSSGELNFMTNLQLANPAMLDDLGQPLAPRTVSVRRNRFLRDGLHERIGLFNYNPFPIRLTLRLIVGADFRDMFDVRGYAPRAARGTIHAPQVCDSPTPAWMGWNAGPISPAIPAPHRSCCSRQSPPFLGNRSSRMIAPRFPTAASSPTFRPRGPSCSSRSTFRPSATAT